MRILKAGRRIVGFLKKMIRFLKKKTKLIQEAKLFPLQSIHAMCVKRKVPERRYLRTYDCERCDSKRLGFGCIGFFTALLIIIVILAILGIFGT